MEGSPPAALVFGKDEPDHQEDNSECLEERDACNEPDDEKDDPESYHAAPREWSSSTLIVSPSHAVRRAARVQTFCHDGSTQLVQPSVDARRDAEREDQSRAVSAVPCRLWRRTVSLIRRGWRTRAPAGVDRPSRRWARRPFRVGASAAHGRRHGSLCQEAGHHVDGRRQDHHAE